MEPSAIRAMTRLAAGSGKELITLAGGMPNPATFPLEQLALFAAEEIRNHEGRSLQYGITGGYAPLTEWISHYLAEKKITAGTGNILCTTGSQQALELITEVLINPGDPVFVESPTYIGALAVFKKSGARMVSVEQDNSGIRLEDLEQKLAQHRSDRVRLVYLISNFQNPSGVSLSAERREHLPALLEKYNAILIEDDPYGEIYFDPLQPPPLAVKASGSEHVLYLGTFSKLVAPTFRCGWIAGDKQLMRRLELAKEAADLCSSLLDQRILYRFCSSPEFKIHLSDLRSFYAKHCSSMLSALQEHMKKDVEWTHPTGGFFVWLRLQEGIDTETFLEHAIRKEKVSYIIGRPFTADNSARNCLRLAFSVETPERIREGIRRLAAALSIE